jgi:hypothetical protein
VPAITISVLIDSYNYGHFIEEAIESVLDRYFRREEKEILRVAVQQITQGNEYQSRRERSVLLKGQRRTDVSI